ATDTARQTPTSSNTATNTVTSTPTPCPTGGCQTYPQPDSVLSVGGYHTCALDDTGVHCWGYNGNGQTTVPGLTNPVMVSAGGLHTCALDDNGVHCWGWNDYGQTNV